MSLTDFQDKGKSSWVYLIQCGKKYKIDFTKNSVGEEVLALQEQGFAKVKLIDCFATVNGAKNRDRLVKAFSIYRTKDGLFNLPELVIDCKKDWFKSCLEEDTAVLAFPKTLRLPLSFHPLRNKRKSGYVYLFQCISSRKERELLEGAYKIGYTTHKVEIRRKAIESEIQGKLETIDYFWSKDPAREEVETHFAMQNFRIWKEWFDIPKYMLKEDRRHLWFSSDEKGFLEVESIDRVGLPVYSPGDFE